MLQHNIFLFVRAYEKLLNFYKDSTREVGCPARLWCAPLITTDDGNLICYTLPVKYPKTTVTEEIFMILSGWAGDTCIYSEDTGSEPLTLQHKLF